MLSLNVPSHRLLTGAALAVALTAGTAHAQDAAPVTPTPPPAPAAAPAPAPKPAPPLGTLGDGTPPETFWDSLFKGKVNLDVRARYEYADARGSLTSNAETIRTRLGYGTAPYNGLSFYVEMEDIRALDDESYDPNRIEPIPARTFISDPEDTELNQAFIKYDSPFLGFGGVFGRQRIKLDDDRFVGNVGWRQNEQTFDAIKITSDFDTKDWNFIYAYLWDVNRIFGDRAQSTGGSLTRDFDSDTHLFNVSYAGLPIGKVTGFVYLMDLEQKGSNATAASNDTFGIRLDGKQKVHDKVSLGYLLSYAYQNEGNGPVDYEADYFLGEGSVIVKDFGTFAAGYELLGADSTTQAFRTPLATLHAFNGWADVLLGPSITGSAIGAGAGIEDIYFSFSPAKLPWKLNGKVVYHIFNTDKGGVDIGDEIDVVLSKKINKNLTVLAKYAHYNADEFSVDTDRFWFDVTFSF